LIVLRRSPNGRLVGLSFFSFAKAQYANLESVSTLAEIEAAAESLPLEQKKELLRFLAARLNGGPEPKHRSDLAEFGGTLRLSEDPLAWQQRVRGEWQ
jgi:hypothetical protein